MMRNLIRNGYVETVLKFQRCRPEIELEDDYTVKEYISFLDKDELPQINHGLVYIEDLYDVNLLFDTGWVPHPYIELVIVEGRPRLGLMQLVNGKLSGQREDSIVFVNHVIAVEPSLYMRNAKLWIKINKNQIKTAARMGRSTLLMKLYPKMLYKSGRPKTDMKIFKPHKLIDTASSYLPVARYSSGMKRGLFFGDKPDTVCGTFYYLEIESDTYLKYDSILKAKNKVIAAIVMSKILRRIGEDDMAHNLYELIEKSFEEDNKLKKWTYYLLNGENEQFNDILTYTPSEIKRLTGFKGSKFYNSLYEYNKLPNKKMYYGNRWLYASEDDFDQEICYAAKLLGYDIILLTHMPGSTQIVSEVLDTRRDSYNHLYK